MQRRAGLLLSFAAVALILVGLPATQSDAQEVFNRVPEVIMPEPHGSVRHDTNGSLVLLGLTSGDIPTRLDADLSRACSQLIFNQTRQGRYFTIIADEDGRRPERYGFANGRGLNLRDPTGLRDQGANYLFYRDGTSECRVYALRN